MQAAHSFHYVIYEVLYLIHGFILKLRNVVLLLAVVCGSLFVFVYIIWVRRQCWTTCPTVLPMDVTPR